MPKFLSTREVAALLHLRVGRISHAVWSGRLPPPERVGDYFIWAESDIQRCARLFKVSLPAPAAPPDLVQVGSTKGGAS